jgi:Ca2+-binding RTX toxin-like protein
MAGIKSDDTLSRLALVASDMAYGAYNAVFAAAGQPLQIFSDTPDYPSPAINDRAPFVVPDGFFVVDGGRIDVDATGFKALVLKNSATNEIVVAFAGIDGPFDPQDWGSASLKLAWNQWTFEDPNDPGNPLRETRQRVFDLIASVSDPNTKIDFVGDSMGGALAEYAAYDWITGQPTPARAAMQARTTLTMFNALGGEDGLRKAYGNIDLSILGNLSQRAAYVVRNDIVSRLGGGYAGVPTYLLDYTSQRPNPANPGTFFDLGIVDAHRIETGFYPNLDARRFEGATLLDPQSAAQRFLKTSQSQQTMELWSLIFDEKAISPTDAMAAMGAGLIAMCALGNFDEIHAFKNALIDGFASSGSPVFDELTSDSAYIRQIGQLRIAYLESKFFTSQLMAVAASGIGQGLYLGFLVSADFDPDNIADAAKKILGKQIQIKKSSDPLDELMRQQWTMSLMPGGINSQLQQATTGLSKPTDYVATLTGVLSADDWQKQTLDYLSGLSGKTGTDLLSYRKQLAEAGLEQLNAFKKAGPEAASSLDAERNAILSAVISDSITLANLPSDYSDAPSGGGSGGGFGGVKTTDELTYRGLRDVFVADLEDIRTSVVEVADKNLNAALIEEITDAEVLATEAAQRPVLAGFATLTNPYANASFDPDAAAVQTSEIKDGGAASYAVYLPYVAGEGGERIRFQLSGDDANSLRVRFGDQTLTPTNGAFEVDVAQGFQKATFTLLAQGNVSAAENVSISATLVDSNGNATHLTHSEGTLTIDAQPDVPQTTRDIVGDLEALDTDPNTSGVQKGYDDLGNVVTDGNSAPDQDDTLFGGDSSDHIMAGGGDDYIYDDTVFSFNPDWIEAGSGDDWVQANQGDDVIDGGSGTDVIQGEGGNDQIYGDTRTTVPDAIAAGEATPGTGEKGDWLVGNAGDDVIVGTADNDVLAGGVGNDLLVGGAGDDVLDGDANGGSPDAPGAWTVIADGLGNDPYDALDPQGRFPNRTADVRVGGAGYQIRNLTDGGDNTIYGGAGNDFAFGGAGNDYIDGGSGNDVIYADALTQFHLSGSDDAALGGDLAYGYGHNGSLAGVAVSAAEGELSAQGFAQNAQTLKTNAQLQQGVAKLS